MKWCVVLVLLLGALAVSAEMWDDLLNARHPLLAQHSGNARTRNVADGCPDSYGCADVGKPCGYIYPADGSIHVYDCTGYAFCNETVAGAGHNGTCVHNVGTYANCSAYVRCGPADMCVSGYCQPKTYSAKVGEKCTSLNTCQGNLLCYGPTGNQTCVPTATTNKFCNLTASPPLSCGDASYCVNNQCLGWGTVPQGQACLYVYHCQGGLYCNTSGICDKPTPTSNTVCTSALNCTGNQKCACSSTGAKVCTSQFTFTQSQIDEAAQDITCFYNAGCIATEPCAACSSANACLMEESITAAQFGNGYYLPGCYSHGICEFPGAGSDAEPTSLPTQKPSDASTLAFSFLAFFAASLLLL